MQNYFGFHLKDSGYTVAGVFSNAAEARNQGCPLIESAKAEPGVTHLPAGYYNILKPIQPNEAQANAIMAEFRKWGCD